MVLDLALSYPGWAPEVQLLRSQVANCQHQGTAQDLGEPLLRTWTSEGAPDSGLDTEALQGLMS